MKSESQPFWNIDWIYIFLKILLNEEKKMGKVTFFFKYRKSH